MFGKFVETNKFRKIDLEFKKQYSKQDVFYSFNSPIILNILSHVPILHTIDQLKTSNYCRIIPAIKNAVIQTVHLLK
jgi:hypothetical protein